mmetsp:Transcript_28956/g.92572  ORF Transcript_28956/g.92572 Transcript_28956/m.92572 type:complete len:83 (-) Transcript_28956:116-364(-)|eukprot:CAMPEP_0118880134 /NCGR_PEP_ID=MMETSP1163-20130328/19746_1 /TAXON_ID=124430 /ORGANISM="Phaeomonas parva, Strain CCMP2877" /LENGTH=82 /DNA_ID=CAMNT_0006816437 /DNA_START=297 /DNA_END=545 /DNA_ORIENTATION=+
MSASTENIQRDWQNRELVEVVQLNVLQITQFLNKFDMSTRYKLARIHERLNALERTLEYCDAAVKGALGEGNENTRTRSAST